MALCSYHFNGLPTLSENMSETRWLQESLYLSDNDTINNQTDHRKEQYGLDNKSEAGCSSDTDNVVEIERILLTRVVVSLCAFGVLGNILTLVLLIQRRVMHSRKRSTQDSGVAKADILGLICLAISNMLFCFSVIPHAWIEFNKYTYESLQFGLYFYMWENAIINIFIMTSTWFTVVMTINRYAHLCHPIFVLRFFGQSYTYGAIAISGCFSLIFNLPRFWLYEITTEICNHPGSGTDVIVHGLSSGILKQNAHLETSYQWMYFFLGVLGPLCTLAYCNCRIIVAVYSSLAVEQKSNKERTLITKILICIVIFYLILVSPAEVIKFFATKIDMSPESMRRYNLAVTVLNTCQAMNFSCNFIPYLVLDKKFRICISNVFCHEKASKQHYGSRALNPSAVATAETYDLQEGPFHSYSWRLYCRKNHVPRS